jgi:hypothetical protein
MPQSKHIFINDFNVMNYMDLFENLYEDFYTILLNIGFNKNEIIHTNNKINSNPHNSIHYFILKII